jgi:hypothetical protein
MTLDELDEVNSKKVFGLSLGGYELSSPFVMEVV